MPKIMKQDMRPKQKDRGPANGWGFTGNVSVLLFGQSGTGKTTTWASFPGPILAIICSGGGRHPEELQSVDTPANRKKITARVCSTGAQVEKLLEEAKDGDWGTVVLDHGTGLRNVLLREELGSDELLQMSWGLATRQQYGAVALKVKEILYRLLSLPCHRVIVAQEKDHNDRGDEEASTDLDDVQKPLLGGDFSKSVINWLNPACSIVVQTFKRPRMVEKVKKLPNGKQLKTMVRGKGVDYCLRVGPHDTVITKFRKPKEIELPDVIVDPDFDKIMELVKGE